MKVSAVTLRLFVDTPLHAGLELPLPAAAARHAQVRRVQPGDLLLLFDGSGQDWPARVLQMGRQQVQVRVGDVPVAVLRELPWAVTLALAVPANERMDILIEKATELGVSAVQPLMSERSVLRLSGERAQRKQEHWQAVAVAACEQSGRAQVPVVAPLLSWGRWLQSSSTPTQTDGGASAVGAPVQLRWLLSLQPGAPALATQIRQRGWDDLSPPSPPSPRSRPTICTLSGPEGGLTPDEEWAAQAAGFVAVNLGPRVLRAETAPLAVLAWLALQAPV